MHPRTTINYRMLALLSLLLSAINVAAAELNPKIQYLANAVPVPPWNIVIGDSGQWYYPIEGNQQVSKDKAIKVERAEEDGAPILKIQWLNKSKTGAFYISGAPINLKALEADIGVAMDIRLDSKLKQPLTMSMDCGYPCRGSINLSPILNAFPQGEWVTLPVPLKCFSAQGTDLTKIDSPLHLQANGKLKLSLRSVKLTKIPDNFPLCQ